ncbi:MAG: hypothetical protein AB1512_09890 [Thermodesulfobacteriota bacterium]
MSIDTCILLDLVLDQNPESIRKLKRHLDDRDIMLICGTVYGEIHPFFQRNKLDADLFLSDLGVRLEMCDKEDYAYAGEKWMQYCQRRRFVCPACVKTIDLACPHCRTNIRFGQHILSDFVIGAFSEHRSDGLLTRDFGYYKAYFPNLKRL